ncbi:MAG: hypothetical protein S4CHLAM102_13220 [Chlamydiia bacterium]|nr:hypothetical protein [Chlamydiia bacterium]
MALLSNAVSVSAVSQGDLVVNEVADLLGEIEWVSLVLSTFGLIGRGMNCLGVYGDDFTGEIEPDVYFAQRAITTTVGTIGSVSKIIHALHVIPVVGDLFALIGDVAAFIYHLGEINHGLEDTGRAQGIWEVFDQSKMYSLDGRNWKLSSYISSVASTSYLASAVFGVIGIVGIATISPMITGFGTAISAIAFVTGLYFKFVCHVQLSEPCPMPARAYRLVV